MQAHIEKPQPDMDLDSDFHILVANMSQNAILTEIVKGLHYRMHKVSWRTFKSAMLKDQKRRVLYQEHHEELMDAIRRQDGERARDTMRLHIEVIRKHFLKEGD